MLFLEFNGTNRKLLHFKATAKHVGTVLLYMALHEAKIQQTKILVTCQMFGDLFLWAGLAVFCQSVI
jgi:hypothetical protein